MQISQINTNLPLQEGQSNAYQLTTKGKLKSEQNKVESYI